VADTRTAGVAGDTKLLPKWLSDIERLLPVRSQFVLSGAIRDLVLLRTGTALAPVPLLRALWATLKDLGFEFMLVHDPVDGVRIYPAERDVIARAVELLPSVTFQNGRAPAQINGMLIEIMRAIVGLRQARGAFVLDFASRLVPSPTQLEEQHRQFFAACEKLSLEASPALPQGASNGPLFNPVFWLLNRAQDLPSWLMLDSERISTHTVPLPARQGRLEAARMLAARFADGPSANAVDVGKFADTFAAGTDGLSLQAMADIAQLANRAAMRLTEVEDAIRGFKLGTIDNPWKQAVLREQIARAPSAIEDRVKGQSQAVTKSVDILMRSVMGLTGAQARGISGRPRGVLFFAGPTGVGKTELAKTLTQVLIGDEQAYIRFDMSEFAEEHAGARLLGAPPGYVGYEAGGELTNAVRQRPFSVILFDEIEKAHPRLLDKFLQILEDGRLTDGRGETTYFSDAVIIFTSNLGIFVEEGGRRVLNVKPGDAYELVEQRVRDAITNYFRFTLSRPEILNRIGENIVVFNFITPPVAAKIFDAMLRNVLGRVRLEHGMELTLDDTVRDVLLKWCTDDLANGGRGIGNRLEMCFINPLARALFSRPGDLRERALRVTSASVDENVYSLELSE
jgi:ATP-dependent Clp protease ATP-binding subunit ClpB